MSIPPRSLQPADDLAEVEAVNDNQLLAPRPPLKTGRDLLDWVANDPTLKRQDRSNFMSAIRIMGEVDNTPLSAIPLDEAFLFNDRYKKIRADKSRNKRRRSDIIGLLNRVLKRAGVIKVGSRRAGKLSQAWIQTIRSTGRRDDEISLSTLARFCSNGGIEPDRVSEETFERFVDETLHHSAFRNPRGAVGKVVRAANRARAVVPDWPLPELPKLVNPRSVSLPESAFRPSLWADFGQYEKQALSPTTDIFDKTYRNPLSTDTLERHRYEVRRLASAQVNRGRNPEEIVNLAALIDAHWVQEAIRWFHGRAGNEFEKHQANLARSRVSVESGFR
jgi:hypothetical protein